MAGPAIPPGQEPSAADLLAARLATESESIAAGNPPSGTQAPAGQTPAPSQGQEPTPPAPAAGSDPEDDEPGSTVDPEIKRLRGESKNYRLQLRAAEARVAEFERAQMTDQQKQSADLAAATTRAEQAESRLHRVDALTAKGYPLTWAGRLQGNTPEEIAADADKLAQELGWKGNGQTPPAPVPNFDAGVRQPPQSEQSDGGMNALIRQAVGRP